MTPDEILAAFGMGPPKKPVLGPLRNAPKPKGNEAHWRARLASQGSLSAYKPTAGERMENGLGGLLSKVVSEKAAQRYARKAMGPLNDLTPVGNVTGAADGARQFANGINRGHLAQAALGAGAFALSVLPGSAGAKKVTGNVLGKLLADEAGAIRAYHGSPHDFDKFSLDKIGTGEGAQAFGHGLYFAENPSVAKSYMSSAQVPEKAIASDYLSHYGSPEKAIAALQASVKPGMRLEHSPALQAIEHIRAGGGGNRFYEVDINAEPEQFLDWDRPLSQQSSAVADPFKQYGVSPNARGEDAYSRVVREITGEDAYWKIGPRGPSAAATEALKGQLPGIRYLDQGSRGVGSGSSNYVLFDDKLVNIVNKR